MIRQVNRAAIKKLTDFKTEKLFGSEVTRLLSRDQLPGIGFDYVRLNKGSELKPHTHEASEAFVYVLEGRAVITLDGKDYSIAAGDTVYVPAGTSHGFGTPDQDVVFLSVQSPPIYPEAQAPDIQFDH